MPECKLRVGQTPTANNSNGGQTNPWGTQSDQEKQQILASTSPPTKQANTCANVLISWAWGAGRARVEASRQQTYRQRQP